LRSANSGGYTKERERIVTAKETRTRTIATKSTAAVVGWKGEISEGERAAKTTWKGRKGKASGVITKDKARII
jgi:hypothetical protein